MERCPLPVRRILTTCQGDSGIDTGVFRASLFNSSAGAVEVSIEEIVTLRDSGQVSTSAFGEADAGDITIRSVSGSIVLAGNSSIRRSAVPMRAPAAIQDLCLLIPVGV